MYAVLASSTNVERFFNAAGRVVCKRKPNLHGFSACEFLFGHANMVRNVRGDALPSLSRPANVPAILEGPAATFGNPAVGSAMGAFSSPLRRIAGGKGKGGAGATHS